VVVPAESRADDQDMLGAGQRLSVYERSVDVPSAP
jgi:hypothetical protein